MGHGLSQGDLVFLPKAVNGYIEQKKWSNKNE